MLLKYKKISFLSIKDIDYVVSVHRGAATSAFFLRQRNACIAANNELGYFCFSCFRHLHVNKE